MTRYTPEQRLARKGYAEQLLANPLFVELLDKLEKDAVEHMVNGKSDEDRRDGAFTVRAARSFRSTCTNMIMADMQRKDAPA